MPFGVHADFIERDLDILWKLGFRWSRMHNGTPSVTWAIINQEKDKMDFIDELINRAHKKGFKLLGMLHMTPRAFFELAFRKIEKKPKTITERRFCYGKSVFNRFAIARFGGLRRWLAASAFGSEVSGFRALDLPVASATQRNGVH